MSAPRVINKILVANRGEIARRIFRTCRDLGISTVAVHSSVDSEAPFVLEADEAVALGGASASESYLRGDAIIRAARATGADAIHPGYGFLSENAEFATACLEAGIIFVGPSPAAIAAMGSKVNARELMVAAGIPVLRGVALDGLGEPEQRAAAEDVGWPVLIKAAYGGGGRGMRVVRHADDFAAAAASARREAAAAFGNDELLLERYIDNPRHVEIQIFGDLHGNVVHLHERECSIQRRHQKILEEAPSPAVDSALRVAMGAAAVEAARAIGYVGAGTVEFLLTPSGAFYFLEINTRLQVEHPVTEMITGLDLVELQIRVAEGRPLGQDALHPRIEGHAIEARIYAEDPAADFRPSTGALRRFAIPELPGVRVDSGVLTGNVVSPNYDPMLAKVIAHGATRADAIRRLRSALGRAEIFGVRTNVALLVAILGEDEFLAGAIDTHYLERHPPSELSARNKHPHDRALSAVAAALSAQAGHRRSAKVLGSVPSAWRNNPYGLQTRSLRTDDGVIHVCYRLGREPRVEVAGEQMNVTLVAVAPDSVTMVFDGVRLRYSILSDKELTYVRSPHGSHVFETLSRFPEPDLQSAPGSLIAPMPGTVVRVAVEVGSEVVAGDLLAVLEAMKMEFQIVATISGRVVELTVDMGATVVAGQVLVVIEEDEPALV